MPAFGAGTSVALARLCFAARPFIGLRASSALEPIWPVRIGSTGLVYDPSDSSDTKPGDTLFYVRACEESNEVRWPYFNAGDYNQDGLVAITDLSAIGQYYLQTHERAQGPGQGELPPPVEVDDNIVAVADGNGDGLISVHDFSSIGQNFGREAFDFKVYGQYKGGGLDEVVATVSGTERLGDPEAVRQYYSVEVPRVRGYRLWITPVSGEFEGPGSDPAQRVDSAFAKNIYTTDSYQPTYELAYDPVTHFVDWYYNLSGDFNLDNWVTSLDITAFGQHFNESVGSDRSDPSWYLDTNHDGKLSVMDIYFLGIFSNEAVQSYRVYNVADPEPFASDPWADLELNPVGELQCRPGGADTVLHYFLQLSPAPASGSYLFVKPVWYGHEGPVSEIIQVP
jgi:hypothetical protein